METRADRPNGRDVGQRWHEERSLILKTNADEAYGFRADGPWEDAMRVAIARTGQTITLTGMARRGFEWEREAAKELALADWEHLQEGLRNVEFWGCHKHYNLVGLDGSTWTFEGRVGQVWHTWREWGPPGGSFYDLGVLFAQLAGLEMP